MDLDDIVDKFVCINYYNPCIEIFGQPKKEENKWISNHALHLVLVIYLFIKL